MSIGFASKETLRNKKESDFEFFQGKIKSTLSHADLYMLDASRHAHGTTSPSANRTEHIAPPPQCLQKQRQQQQQQQQQKQVNFVVNQHPSAGAPDTITATLTLSRPVESIAGRLGLPHEGQDASLNEDMQLLHQRRHQQQHQLLQARIFERSRLHQKLEQVQQRHAFTIDALSPDAREQLVRQVHHKLLENLNAERLCVHCGQVYCEVANLGRYQCRWHPGKIDWTGVSHLGHWTCCGLLADSFVGTSGHFEGCCLADHLEVQPNKRVPVTSDLPVVVAELLGLGSRDFVFEEAPHFGQELQRKCKILRALKSRAPTIATYRPMYHFQGHPVNDMLHITEVMFN